MSAKLRRNIPALRNIFNASKSQQKKLIGDAPANILGSLCECAHNVLKGNVPLTTKQFKHLKRYHKQLKTVSRKKTSLKSKRKTFQSGGFLGALIAPIAKLLLGAL